ncbi:MAG TPA: IS110 family transposase [Thermoplasmata archaeon]|nr:IS110 family transposase [Thermoplasmata archaeon]
MESASSAEVFVGLDVHRKSIVATALDDHGLRLSQVKLGVAPAELIEYLRGLPGHKQVALEAGSSWAPVYDAAESIGASVVLSNPLRTRLIADASLKTDKVDSEALATLLRVRALPTAFAPPAEVRDLRTIVSERIYYKRRAAAIKNRTYSVLLRRGMEYEDSILSRKHKREELRALHLSEIDRGLDTLRFFEDTCRDLDRQIHRAWLESEDAQLLSTIPGIGELTSVALVAFICPIERFSTSEKLSSYVGLCPSMRQSGESIHHGSLKQDSNGLLRWLLVEASWTHRRKVPHGAVAKVARRVSRRRGKPQGTGAAAHKLVKIIHAMLKRKEAFHHQAPGPSTSVESLRRPRTTARLCVRRATLELPTANRPQAP